MNEKNIESFLKSINCANPGMGLDDFTNAVIANLPEKEMYEFKVVYAIDKYPPKSSSGKSSDESKKKYMEDRAEFIKNQLPNFKDILSKLNVKYSEEFNLSILGILIHVELNSEQARQLKSNSKIKHMYAYNPFTPTPGCMLLDKSMLPPQ